jgi:hypothetical protein
MKNISQHDMTTDLEESFNASKSNRVIVSIKWENVTGATTELYRLLQSNIDSVNGDNVPAIPNGVLITNGGGSATIEVSRPADNFTHKILSGGISGGTIDIKTKILYSND